MAFRIVYARPDGGVSIVRAAPKQDLEKILGPLTEEEYRAFVSTCSIPSGVTAFAELPDDWTPPDRDRTFRNAWAFREGAVAVDMPKAREIWRERMRQARAPKLAALDVAYMWAQAADDRERKIEIAARKQALRDVTSDPAIDAAATPDDLRQVWSALLV